MCAGRGGVNSGRRFSAILFREFFSLLELGYEIWPVPVRGVHVLPCLKGLQPVTSSNSFLIDLPTSASVQMHKQTHTNCKLLPVIAVVDGSVGNVILRMLYMYGGIRKTIIM